MNTPFLPEALQRHWIGPVREHATQADRRGAWRDFAARLRAHSGVNAARVSTMQQIIVSGHYVCDSGAVASAVLASLDLPRRH
jgi:anti-sigma28 factor (negative regulator of flagellin synthesis)